ncbi:MAG: DTW domain-containing protein [Myxococcaceae bacterium]
MDVVEPQYREVCLTCRRPKRVCWCDAVTKVPSQTRVVFLQHPREAKVPISTCRMAHLSLPNSELHIGTTAVGNAALEALAHQDGVAVLFPSDTATDVDALATPPKALVVVDGTWSNAKKVVTNCPVLSKLPRLKFFPDKPGNYRIRAEPEEHCLATIEATAFVLDRLERAPGRFTPILSAFDAMVERQLAFIEGSERTSRHKFRRKRNTAPVDPWAPLRGQRVVVVFGEANAWPLCDPARPLPDDPELVELAAERLDTGERFRRLLKPVRPLGPRVPLHLDVSAERILAAEPRDEVLRAWDAFLKPGELQVGWGSFCNDLLVREGRSPERFVNLRSVVANFRGGRVGSVEGLAESLGAKLTSGAGRALRRLEALTVVTRASLDGTLERHRAR